ncbi:MAG: hypothetical protein M1829_003621 [Trizodia sp. TS-e1964]|nr:MAG: hypothetical protein M1829_003621 [Trizodia sp. TS-e1964]
MADIMVASPAPLYISHDISPASSSAEPRGHAAGSSNIPESSDLTVEIKNEPAQTISPFSAPTPRLGAKLVAESSDKPHFAQILLPDLSALTFPLLDTVEAAENDTQPRDTSSSPTLTPTPTTTPIVSPPPPPPTNAPEPAALSTTAAATPASDVPDDMMLDEYGDLVTKPDAERICTACNTLVLYRDAIHAPCSHDYCQPCARSLFENAVPLEANFPPRCCWYPIPITVLEGFFDADFMALLKSKEYEYRSTRRTYCAKPTCSAFIRPDTYSGSAAKCPECNAVTCAECNKPFHDGKCLKDKEFKKFIRFTRRRGWRECFRCSRVLEKNDGCNHMT